MALTFTPNNPIIPIRMGIKHDPPTLALVYKRKQQDIKERIYSILLNSLVELSDPKIIALKLFEEHALILNENIIDMDQVEKLVTILQQKYEEKKGLAGFSHPHSPDMISPIHTYQPQNKDPYNIQDTEPDIFLEDTSSNQKNGNVKPKFNNNDSIQGESNFYEQENHMNYQTPKPNSQGMNNSPPQEQYNSQQQSEEAEFYSSGYNPSFSTRNGSASEQKKQKIKSKNERNKLNMVGTHKNLNELISGNQESSMQQYMNSHYNYGQRRNNADNDYLNENAINDYQNEFIDEEVYDQNNEYNEDYHNLMNEEEENYPTGKYNNKQANKNNNKKENFAFQKTPMKGYIDQQMDDYQSNFNSYENSYGMGSNNNNSNSNYSYNQYNQNSQNTNNQSSNFFSKRQTASSSYDQQQQQQPQQNDNKKRRNKFGQLRDLANQHKDSDDNMIDDQLEII